MRARFVQAGLAIRSLIYDVAFFFQALLQRASQARFVFDEQDPHEGFQVGRFTSCTFKTANALRYLSVF